MMQYISARFHLSWRWFWQSVRCFDWKGYRRMNINLRFNLVNLPSSASYMHLILSEHAYLAVFVLLYLTQSWFHLHSFAILLSSVKENEWMTGCSCRRGIAPNYVMDRRLNKTQYRKRCDSIIINGWSSYYCCIELPCEEQCFMAKELIYRRRTDLNY